LIKTNQHSYRQVIEAGANALVAGSAVFGAPDYAEGMGTDCLLILCIKNTDFIHVHDYASKYLSDMIKLVCSYKRNQKQQKARGSGSLIHDFQKI
jgi:hypothetical protein